MVNRTNKAHYEHLQRPFIKTHKENFELHLDKNYKLQATNSLYQTNSVHIKQKLQTTVLTMYVAILWFVSQVVITVIIYFSHKTQVQTKHMNMRQ